LFAVIGLLIILNVLFRYPDQRALLTAFGIGYVSHLIGDGIGPILAGDYAALGYVLWPLTTVPNGDSQSFIDFFLTLELTAMVFGGVILTVISGLLWVYDGLPGVKDLFVISKTESEPIPQED
jgi:hypothetical protein